MLHETEVKPVSINSLVSYFNDKSCLDEVMDDLRNSLYKKFPILKLYNLDPNSILLIKESDSWKVECFNLYITKNGVTQKYDFADLRSKHLDTEILNPLISEKENKREELRKLSAYSDIADIIAEKTRVYDEQMGEMQPPWQEKWNAKSVCLTAAMKGSFESLDKDNAILILKNRFRLSDEQISEYDKRYGQRVRTGFDFWGPSFTNVSGE
jgi:hypothetical protein